jgi:8-oxo-(d)GTP phosphatase
MTVLFVRHAVAEDRDRWEGDDDARPLTDRGRDQAEALTSLLSEFEIDSVLSSPSLRCVDTVEPLARVNGLQVRREPKLAEGNGRTAAEFIAAQLRRSATVVMCSHGDVIPDAMAILGFDCNRCAKGSTWVLDGAEARYLHAP